MNYQNVLLCPCFKPFKLWLCWTHIPPVCLTEFSHLEESARNQVQERKLSGFKCPLASFCSRNSQSQQPNDLVSLRNSKALPRRSLMGKIRSVLLVWAEGCERFPGSRWRAEVGGLFMSVCSSCWLVIWLLEPLEPGCLASEFQPAWRLPRNGTACKLGNPCPPSPGPLASS